MDLMHKAKKAQTLIAVSAVAVVLAYGSYMTGFNQAKVTLPKPSVPEVKAGKIGPDSIVKSQQALAVGEVTAKNTDSITVKGDDGKTSSFKLSPSVTVATISTGSATAKPQDRTAIVTNQKALVTLDLQGSDYLVTNITYIPK